MIGIILTKIVFYLGIGVICNAFFVAIDPVFERKIKHDLAFAFWMMIFWPIEITICCIAFIADKLLGLTLTISDYIKKLIRK